MESKNQDTLSPRLAVISATPEHKSVVPSGTVAKLAAYGNVYEQCIAIQGIEKLHDNEIDAKSLRLIGYSGPFTKDYLNLGETTDEIRRASPHAIIVAGGKFISLFTKDAFARAPQVDIIVRGCGFQAWSEIAQIVSSQQDLDREPLLKLLKKELKGRPGIYFQNDEIPADLRKLTVAPHVRLEHVLQPNYDLLLPGQKLSDRFARYKDKSWLEMQKDGLVLSVQDQENCANSCVFCAMSAFRSLIESGQPVVENRPAKDVVEEIKYLVELADVPGKIPMFLGGVDRFNNPDVFKEILDLLIEENLNERVVLTINTSIEEFVKALENGHPVFEEMSKAGVWRIVVGVESLSAKIQNYISGKNVDSDKLAILIDKSNELGIVPLIEIMVGFPLDSTETLEESLSKLIKLRDSLPPFVINVHRVTPIPGTVLYNDAINSNLIKKDTQLEDFMKGEALMGTAGDPPLSPEEVSRWIEEFNNEFYSEKYIAKLKDDPRVGLWNDAERKR